MEQGYGIQRSRAPVFALRAFRIGLAAFVAAAAIAQDPLFRTDTALMEVEVRVTRRGEFVRGLTSGDFTLLENGRPQEIRVFEHVRLPGAAELSGDAPAAAPASGAATASNPANAALDQMRRTRFLYIAVRVAPEDRVAVTQAIRKYLDEQLRPGVLVSLEGRPFTSSREQLEQDLADMTSQNWSGEGGMTDRIAVAQASESAYGAQFDSMLADLNEDFGEEQESIAQISQLYEQLSLYRYLDLVHALSIYPGQKSVVLFSRGLSIDEENLDIVDRFAADAMRARVRFYTVDVNRLSARPPGGDATESVDFNAALTNPNSFFGGRRDSFQDNQDGLVTLARETGGRAILNSNDLGEVFDRVNEETSEFYVLGYYPEDTSEEGRFRKIKIEVSRPGVKLDYQKGYYEEQDFSHMSRSEKELHLRRAIERDTPLADLPLTANFEFFRTADGNSAIAYGIGIHPSDLPVEQTKKGTKLAFTVAARAYSEEGGAGAFEERKLEMVLDPKGLEEIARDPVARFHYSSEMRLAPGRYRWKAVVRDENTGLLGSYRASLTVPAFDQTDAYSTILLTNRVTRIVIDKKNKYEPAAIDVADARFLPTSAAIFRKGEPIYVLYDLYNLPDGELASPPGARLALFRDGKRCELTVTAHQAIADPGRSGVRYRAAFDTAGLAAGEYVLVAMLPNRGDEEARGVFRKFRIAGPQADPVGRP